jgi:hypothetical protein
LKSAVLIIILKKCRKNSPVRLFGRKPFIPFPATRYRMIGEHLVYSAALAILVGMLFFRFTGRDSSWIIILLSFAPDIDFFATILHRFRITVFFEGNAAYHGMFHNIGAMFIFGIIFALVLYAFEVRFFDALFFSLIGFGAHLVEDALVYSEGYAFLWPLSHQTLGLGWITSAASEESYRANFFHIANTDVLFIGVVFLLIAMFIRTRVEGSGWIRWYMPEKIYRTWFAKDNPGRK